MHEVPFRWFCDLLATIASIPAVPTPTKKARRFGSWKKTDDVGSDDDCYCKGECDQACKSRRKVGRVLKAWFDRLHRPLPPRTGVIIFRLLFPEEDTRRRYNLQETALSRALAKVLQVNSKTSSDGAELLKWSEEGNWGCLGTVVQNVMEKRKTGAPKDVSIDRIDRLLDELASYSDWSRADVRKAPRTRPRQKVLEELYSSVTPRDAGFLTQIILRDLRPLLYPTPSQNAAVALEKYQGNSYYELTIRHAMRKWHWAMIRLYRTRADLDHAAEKAETLPEKCPTPEEMKVLYDEVFRPEIGIPIEIPKNEKAYGGCEYAIQRFSQRERCETAIWAETKYDGFRMQIHVNTSLPYHQQIKIFSKSKRDSTRDRKKAHDIIRAALGLTPIGPFRDHRLAERLAAECKSPCERTEVVSGIFEAELCAYDETENHGRGKITEFFKVASLLDEGSSPYKNRIALPTIRAIAASELADRARSQSISPSHGPHASPSAREVKGDNLHLILVFFDILLLNRQNLMYQTYEKRRSILESVVVPIRGYSALAERERIDMKDAKLALAVLCRLFGQIIAKREEGLILKSSDSTYNDYHQGQRWIKMRKDLIEGFGDAADFCIVGVSWSKDRARELRVPTGCFTTFTVGLQTNRDQCKRRPHTKPHYLGLFHVSYGLTREQYFLVQGQIELQGTCMENDRKALANWPFTFEVASSLEKESRPTHMLRQPFVFELVGASFSKAKGSHYYELRFPRITKMYTTEDRIAHALTLDQLQSAAKKVLFPESLQVERTISDLFDNPDAFMLNDDSQAYQEQESREWERRLAGGTNLVPSEGWPSPEKTRQAKKDAANDALPSLHLEKTISDLFDGREVPMNDDGRKDRQEPETAELEASRSTRKRKASYEFDDIPAARNPLSKRPLERLNSITNSRTPGVRQSPVIPNPVPVSPSRPPRTSEKKHRKTKSGIRSSALPRIRPSSAEGSSTRQINSPPSRIRLNLAPQTGRPHLPEPLVWVKVDEKIPSRRDVLRPPVSIDSTGPIAPLPSHSSSDESPSPRTTFWTVFPPRGDIQARRDWIEGPLSRSYLCSPHAIYVAAGWTRATDDAAQEDSGRVTPSPAMIFVDRSFAEFLDPVLASFEKTTGSAKVTWHDTSTLDGVLDAYKRRERDGEESMADIGQLLVEMGAKPWYTC